MLQSGGYNCIHSLIHKRDELACSGLLHTILSRKRRTSDCFQPLVSLKGLIHTSFLEILPGAFVRIMNPAEEEGNISSFKDYSQGASASDAKEEGSKQEESKASTGPSKDEEDKKDEDRPGRLSRGKKSKKKPASTCSIFSHELEVSHCFPHKNATCSWLSASIQDAERLISRKFALKSQSQSQAEK